MKYRKLNLDELRDLREDFVHFLSANSVTAEDWVKIKKMDPDAAEKLIEVFSDIVWEKVLSRIRYVRFINPQAIRVIHFGENNAELIQLEIKDETFNLSDHENIRGMAEGNLDLRRFDPEMTTGNKKYSADREREIFIHLEQGWQPTDEVFWAALSSMIVKDS